MKKALILGTHSFIDGGSKVGMQHLAEGLARNGWQVDYIATSSSLFDIWGRQRHARLRRVWLQGQDKIGVPVEIGLTEYEFKAFFPAHKIFLKFNWQLKALAWLAPSWMKTNQYDLCIHETSPNIVYFPLCTAKLRIFRLSDWPDGFAHDLHLVLIKQFSRNIFTLIYDEIWTVSKPLTDYAVAINSDNRVITIPNGVENFFNSTNNTSQRLPKSAIFLGGMSAWLDIDLINLAAQQLPDWTFDIYGPGKLTHNKNSKNVHFHPRVPREHVPSLLARYEVGLIPFKETNGRMHFVERPLKFYEYISAGLGVASTDTGSLKSGMADLACYGNTPSAFAEAITMAGEHGRMRTAEFCHRFMQENSWESVISLAVNRINLLLQKYHANIG